MEKFKQRNSLLKRDFFPVSLSELLHVQTGLYSIIEEICLRSAESYSRCWI